MAHFKSTKNYTAFLNKLNFSFPGLPNIPRAPDYNRDLVDVYMYKKRLELVDRIPVFNADSLRATHAEESLEQYGKLSRNLLANLLMSGYSSVVDELGSLIREEEILLENSEESGRIQSFTEDETRFSELVQGLVDTADAEKSDNVSDKVRVRKSLGEKMVLLGDFWLARKMFAKTFSYLEFYHDENLDKMRVELWCLLSYICIYHEDSQEIGYDIPRKCLLLGRTLCKGKNWTMPKSIMSIFVPKPIQIYGLKNDWLKIKTDFVDMYMVVTTLLHVLHVKKARYWQDELKSLELKGCDHKQKDKERKWIKDKITETLTSALAYADEVRQNNAFVATALRRGLFFEEHGELEKAMEDFNAMHLLSLSFDDREATTIALNRIGHNYKASGNHEMALEHFAMEWELSCENDFDELRADALQDLGMILLEEGQTWEADECISQAHSLFSETKQTDTPNDLDEVTWALTGVTRGQHLWGRFATLIRSQERSKVKSIYDWKMLRKQFPVASMPQKWYQTQRRDDFDMQYYAVMPKTIPDQLQAGRLSFSLRRTPTVKFSQSQEQTDKTRRLFEFTPTEVEERQSILRMQGFGNVFGFINASEKPRIVPSFHETADVNWSDDPATTLNEIRASRNSSEFTLENQRSLDVQRRATRMRKSLSHIMKARKSMSSKAIEDWIGHDYRVKTWERRSKATDRWKKMMDPKLGVGERLKAFLEDMDDIAQPDDDVTHTFFSGPEEEDQSEDTELSKDFPKRSGMTDELLNEFIAFDDKQKQLGF